MPRELTSENESLMAAYAGMREALKEQTEVLATIGQIGLGSRRNTLISLAEDMESQSSKMGSFARAFGDLLSK